MAKEMEKEFDNALVDVDLILGDIDADQLELTLEGRRKLTVLSSSFASLVHACQTLSLENSIMKTDIKELKREVTEAESIKKALQDELQWITIRFHSLQCELLSKTAPLESDHIKKKLDKEMDEFQQGTKQSYRILAKMEQMKKENKKMRNYIGALQSEVYSARLAAKYLDKELAGRIQQIQLLSREMLGAEHDRLWEQIEAEIHCHRHKAVVKACRGRKVHGDNCCESSAQEKKSKRGAKLRTVKIYRNQDEGLGISVTGGREHGVPILISEIHPGQVAERSALLNVGDALMSVNGIDLWPLKHADAVKVLSEQTGDLKLRVLYIPPDKDSDDEDGLLKICAENGTVFNMYEKVGSNGIENGADDSAVSNSSQETSSNATCSKDETVEEKSSETIDCSLVEIYKDMQCAKADSYSSEESCDDDIDLEDFREDDEELIERSGGSYLLEECQKKSNV
uniref:PDZ domain-containing protein n=1 Tax=Trichuris muris TaxID=70415 RepID=A0A5S6Q6X7_TRIMR